MAEGAKSGIAAVVALPGDIQRLRAGLVDDGLRKSIEAISGREMPSTLPLVAPDQFPTSAGAPQGVLAMIPARAALARILTPNFPSPLGAGRPTQTPGN